MAFAIGLQVLRSLCAAQKPLEWQKAKLSPALFSSFELPMFDWVQAHLKAHHILPRVETFGSAFPAEVVAMDTPEPPSYYLRLLENRCFYQRINKANLQSPEILKANQDDHVKAAEAMRQCVNDINGQKYRMKILDVGLETAGLVLAAYHNVGMQECMAQFGLFRFSVKCP